MMGRSLWIAASLVLASASLCQGQVVQLPTFGVFSVRTTVVVPDRGGAYLGGVSRARYGSSAYGTPGFSKVPGMGRLFTNRSSGAVVSSSDAFVSATIHDLHEMDRAVLAAAAGQRTRLSPAELARRQKAAFLARHIDRAGDAPVSAAGPGRVVSLDRGKAGAKDAKATAQEVFRLAQRAEATGRLGAARCGYRRVERMAAGELRDQAKARLAALKVPDPVPPTTAPRRPFGGCQSIH